MTHIQEKALSFKHYDRTGPQLPIKVRLSTRAERGRIRWHFQVRTLLTHELIHLAAGEDRQDRPAHAAVYVALKRFEAWRRDNKNTYRVAMIHAPGLLSTSADRRAAA
jgi:hypothetical protein